MKFQLTILTLAVLALAKPQAPPDPAPAPPDPAPTPPSTSEPPAPPPDPPAPAPPAPPPVPPPADPPADPPAEPSQPPPPPPPPPPSQPAPPPSGPAPVPPTATPAPAPPPDPSPPPPPSSTAEPPPPEGPICECGYTYCSAVLKGMDKPWNEDQLSQAYCSTPNVKCDGESPASSIDNALFICLCDQPSQKVGNHLEFLCGCDKCLVVKPDYRGRCKTPPLAGKGGKGDGKGNKVRGTNPLGFWM
ncbi:hypothetical protein H9Q72_005353 [Fusarium xylarioides]|uniref:Filamentous hemagglutinin n=1 Tax=Fusarium xylarioides TaxID=221167 RepID=A0A9P7LQ58_9HYPO|nr:hypothetical protein H9Q70_000054 [Fusarium xylarioides]KAG5766586.1 hypothetical protein H9Q72_005353 [Fusarium xylarioides]KAG5785959.1 hypothetical protein H9Q73_000397 [Fusarium xylarioides]KAG5821614.1 hypothetical protein H9Q71_000145 [Fusarium xylarioides]KAG5829920.1 hypothetical protein H9Q74_000073 [Fusarium xylarioides]